MWLQRAVVTFLQHLLNGVMQPKCDLLEPRGSTCPRQMKSLAKKRTEVKRQKTKNCYTTQARGHLLIILLGLCFRLGVTVCFDFSSLPPHMAGIPPDWLCSGGRLSTRTHTHTHAPFCPMRCRYAAPDRPLARRSLPALLSLTVTRRDRV